MAETIPHFDRDEFTLGGVTRPVLAAATDGPPVILIHEVYGITATLAAFAETIRAAGFRVYLPVLYGSTDPVGGTAGKARRFARFLCVAHQFRLFAQDTSGPWADWLRALVDEVCRRSGAPAAGAIGLCLTGNFALAMALDPRVRAPIMGEPSLPAVGDGPRLTEAELAELRSRPDLEVRAYRYSTDRLCRAAQFDRLARELGSAFRGETIEASETLHSVFTEHLRDARGNLRHDKVDEVIAFLRRRLLESKDT